MTKKEKQFVKSLGLKKFRNEYNCFIVEGIKSVDEVLASNYTVLQLFGYTDFFINRTFPESVKINVVSEKEMREISQLMNPQPIIAIVQQKLFQIDTSWQEDMIIALDTIRDPGNLGTIIRTADWFGIKHIVCSENTTEWFNPKVIQATMGSFTRIELVYTNLDTFLSQKNKTQRILATLLQGESCHQFQYQKNDIILIGNEANGIHNELLKHINHALFIPHFTDVPIQTESLNAAMACGILCYQAKMKLS